MSYTPAQNGRAERKHRHIIETGLSMLFHASVPVKYWIQAFRTTVYIINRLPSSVLQNKSPFEILYSVMPAYDNFHVFGCRVYLVCEIMQPTNFHHVAFHVYFLVIAQGIRVFAAWIQILLVFILLDMPSLMKMISPLVVMLEINLQIT